MRFHKFSGIHQLIVADDEDLAQMDRLDPARWAATSAPLRDLQSDPKFLAFVDAAGTGRIRVAQLVAARDWLLERLSGREHLGERTDTLQLRDLASNESGGMLSVAAERVLRHQGMAGQASATLSDVRSYRNSYAATLANGDGVVPPHVVDDPQLQQLVSDILATVGGQTDVGGEMGIGHAEVDRSVAQAAVWLAWTGQAETAMPWGDSNISH